MAGETNIVLYIAAVTDRLLNMYTFGRFCVGSGGDFAVDTEKEELDCLNFFFLSPPPDPYLARPEKARYTVQSKKGSLQGSF